MLLVRIVKFQFLAQFPMDYLSHPVVSSLIVVPLQLFSTSADNVIYSFVS